LDKELVELLEPHGGWQGRHGACREDKGIVCEEVVDQTGIGRSFENPPVTVSFPERSVTKVS
jgi:hypothetical protein